MKKFILLFTVLLCLAVSTYGQDHNYEFRIIEKGHIKSASKNGVKLKGKELLKADIAYQEEKLKRSYEVINDLLERLHTLENGNPAISSEQQKFDGLFNSLKRVEQDLNARNFFAAGFCCDPPGTWEGMLWGSLNTNGTFTWTNIDGSPHVPKKDQNYNLEDLTVLVDELKNHVEQLHNLDKREPVTKAVPAQMPTYTGLRLTDLLFRDTFRTDSTIKTVLLGNIINNSGCVYPSLPLSSEVFPVWDSSNLNFSIKTTPSTFVLPEGSGTNR